MSITNFNAQIKDFAKKHEMDIEKTVRTIALHVWNGVTNKTPVDTGRARANWNLATGSADTSTTISTSEKHFSLSKGDGKKVIYITNNLPYINMLENGSSRKATRGMVAVTLAEIAGGLK